VADQRRKWSTISKAAEAQRAATYRNEPLRFAALGAFCFGPPLRFFERARLLVRLNHVARLIVNANHSIMSTAEIAEPLARETA
jgi:hypothetical protein